MDENAGTRGDERNPRFRKGRDELRRSWSMSISEEVGPGWHAEERKGSGVEKEMRKRKISVARAGNGSGGISVFFTGAADVICGAKLNSRKV